MKKLKAEKKRIDELRIKFEELKSMNISRVLKKR